VRHGQVSTRTWFRNGIHDRFPADIDAVKPCTGVNAGAIGALRLCPACRVFGWVAREQPGGAAPGEARADVARAVAVRSRVRFADALFFDRETGVAAPLITHPATLQILGAPRPATVRFYLTLKNGRVVSGTSAEPGYDDPELVVRGRKFYRRHARSARFVRKRSNQNRTLRDHMASGQSAPFEVRFDNLAPLELGALLWSLELEPDWRHRLGLAKPLGFGDVSIRVEALRVFAGDRWSADPDEGATSSDVQAL
jgi:CRISPR-associated protein (TIGR03986 family)